MNKELPFTLGKNHKAKTKYQWKKLGMKFIEDEFKIWYEKYIYATNCNICNDKFKTVKDRNLDHDHDTGEIRDIICRSCNNKRYDKAQRSDNKTGFRNIFYDNSKNRYVFSLKMKDKLKWIKSSKDLDKLVEFAENWYKENNYYT